MLRLVGCTLSEKPHCLKTQENHEHMQETVRDQKSPAFPRGREYLIKTASHEPTEVLCAGKESLKQGKRISWITPWGPVEALIGNVWCQRIGPVGTRREQDVSSECN